MLVGILTGLMGLVLMLNLAKKAEEQLSDFWVQMSLTGGKSLEWLNTKDGEFEMHISKLVYGKVKYFFQHFDFTKALEIRDKLTLESNIFLAFCSNRDRVVLIDQSGAMKCLQKLMLTEREKGTLKRDPALSKTYLAKDGFTNVFEIEFKEDVAAVFELASDGKFTHYRFKDES